MLEGTVQTLLTIRLFRLGGKYTWPDNACCVQRKVSMVSAEDKYYELGVHLDTSLFIVWEHNDDSRRCPTLYDNEALSKAYTINRKSDKGSPRYRARC
jgi:hypothetical protein